MIIEMIIIFALGIVGDVLATLYYLFVGRLQALPASLMTSSITLLNFFVIEKFISSSNWMLIVFYALGSSIGCFVIIATQKKKLKKRNYRNSKGKFSIFL